MSVPPPIAASLRQLHCFQLENENQFEKVWDNSGTTTTYPCSFFKPVVPQGYFCFGDVAQRGSSSVYEGKSMLVKCDSSPEPVLSAPTGWKAVWNSRGYTAMKGNITIWEPIPKENYVALGYVATEGLDEISFAQQRIDVVCLRVNVANQAVPCFDENSPSCLTQISKSVTESGFSIWTIVQIEGRCHTIGTFWGFSASISPAMRATKVLYGLTAEAELEPLTLPPSNPFHSSFPTRNYAKCKWYVDAVDYYSDVADALETAQFEIFISGWCVSPELYLRRNHPIQLSDRLDHILKKMAKKGVRIYVLLWWDSKVMNEVVNSNYSSQRLTEIDKFIQVIRHPVGYSLEAFSYTHHQKIVVVDQRVAFVGGIDLCFGRFDTGQHLLFDKSQGATSFPGKDYYNPAFVDFKNLHEPFADLVTRFHTPRMPWHDIHCCVMGDAARDVAINFGQRWNHHYRYNFAGSSQAALTNQSTAATSSSLLSPITISNQICISDGTPVVGSVVLGAHEVQILRSVGPWSLDMPVEKSIQNAYLHYIEHAQHYVYIENQYFISYVNGIANAIISRLSTAIEQNQTFRMYLLVPLHPSGSWEAPANKKVSHQQYRTIMHIMNTLKKKYENAKLSNWITFYSLRKVELRDDRYFTDQIYIHSKLMIVDDRITIIGSANVNDRSMCGDRDSEICALIVDREYVPSQMNRSFYLAGTFASSLRKQLFVEHLGISHDHQFLCDPTSILTYDFVRRRALDNQHAIESMFTDTPSNKIASTADLLKIRKGLEKTNWEEKLKSDASRFAEIKGHIVRFPYKFLENDGGATGFTQLETWVPDFAFQ